MTTQKVKHVDFEFETKEKGKRLIIGGMANANVPDRMGERVEPRGMNLKNYQKNPVILYNHGHDMAFGTMPVGKALDVKLDDKGIYIEAEISQSKSDKITAIRDLVRDGYLKTFSIGFNPLAWAEEDDMDAGKKVLVITEAELIENSVVPIPMNQDSTFGVLSKKYDPSKLNNQAKSILDSLTRREKLDQEKAWVPMAIEQRISELSMVSDMNREKSIRAVSEITGQEILGIEAMMTGQTEITEPTIKAFASVLGIQEKFLMDLFEANDELIAEFRNYEISIPEVNDEPPTQETKAVGVQAVRIPKDQAKSAEEAKQMAEEADYSVARVDEEENSWIAVVADPEKFDMEKAEEVDLGDGAFAVVAPIKSAEPMSDDDEGEGEGDEDSPKDDEGEGDEKNTAPPQTKGDQIDDNPYLHEARQTNILLGTLIREIQTMSGKLDGLVEITTDQNREKPIDEEPDDDMGGEPDETEFTGTGDGKGADEDDRDGFSKSLDEMRATQARIMDRLKRYGIEIPDRN